ncbi:hypothetical protein LX32DRAFT_384376 [Colletotrichum zoysiae]|uniref:Uncharacterized protein n=1 Tax=Colletotrichum zoysiae TaxID=1216348 RepID=A0AAD9HIU7_9PEZI|nr:hypothetical protein LX32DRAFT_384376 [Colletotrichum zoysiae]
MLLHCQPDVRASTYGSGGRCYSNSPATRFSFDITSGVRPYPPSSSTTTRVARVPQLLTNSPITLLLSAPAPLRRTMRIRFLRVSNTNCSTSQSPYTITSQLQTDAAIFSIRRKSDGPLEKERNNSRESLCLGTVVHVHYCITTSWRTMRPSLSSPSPSAASITFLIHSTPSKTDDHGYY